MNYFLTVSTVILMVGILGFADNCKNKACCQSYSNEIISHLGGTENCAYGTFLYSRPYSLPLVLLGIFLVIGSILTERSTR